MDDSFFAQYSRANPVIKLISDSDTEVASEIENWKTLCLCFLRIFRIIHFSVSCQNLVSMLFYNCQYSYLSMQTAINFKRQRE